MKFIKKSHFYFKIFFCLFLTFSGFSQGFEKEIRAFEKLDSIAMPPKGIKLFLGSSSFVLWNSFNADMKGLNAINRGFGGSTLKDALYYFDRMVVKYQPSWVFLYEGDNDLMGGKSPEEIPVEFVEFSTRLAKQVPNAKLVYVSVRPSLAREAIRGKQQELNQRIVAISAKKKGHFVIDMHSPFFNPDGSLMQDIFIADKLHLNEKGYKIFAKQIQNFTFDIEKADTTKLVQPEIKIFGKKVNLKNAEALSLSISCKDCKNKNYLARFYSNKGWNSVVNEGKMTKDSIVIENVKVTDVNDGVFYTTVFILDSIKTLLGIRESISVKDVIPPKSAVLKTNLANFGRSNIDSLIYQIKASESKGYYTLSIKQATVTPIKQSVNVPVMKKTEALVKTFIGTFSNPNISIKDSLLKGFEDGLIEITCVVRDSVDNESDPVVSKIYKDTRDPVLSITKTSSTGGKLVLNVRSNEYVSNSLSNADMTIKNGSITGIKKLDNKNFEVSINRTCADSLSLSVLAGKLLDSVGNKNQSAILSLLDLQTPSLTSINILQPDCAVATGIITVTSTNQSGDIFSINGSTYTNTTGVFTGVTAGSYILTVKSSAGCVSAGRSITIMTKPPSPITPVINVTNIQNLSTSATGTYQWYLDNKAISGATQNNYVAIASGAYTLVVINAQGCSSAPSEAIAIAITGILELPVFAIYPNPSNDRITINSDKIGDIEIVNSSGTIIHKIASVHSGESIDLSKYGKGKFFIRFTDVNLKTISIPLIKD